MQARKQLVPKETQTPVSNWDHSPSSINLSSVTFNFFDKKPLFYTEFFQFLKNVEQFFVSAGGEAENFSVWNYDWHTL